MTDYTELVKALRTARTVSIAWKGLMNDAAAAIEELQSILTEADKKQAYQHDYICELVAEKEELQAETERLKAQLPKRGKWEPIYFDNKPLLVECSNCGARRLGKAPHCLFCGSKMEDA